MSRKHEGPPDRQRAEAAAHSERQSVSIADVLKHPVAPDWFESVAIVAGLCSALDRQPATAMPSLADIHLTPDGAIALAAPGCQADDAVLRLLHDCLRLAAHPPALRLFVLNALSSDRHRSPAALEEALAYYERPGRDAIIRGVRARCLGESVTGGSQGADANRPSSFEADKASGPRSATPSTRRRRLLVAGGITVCAVCLSAVATLIYAHGVPAVKMSNMQGLAGYVAETGRDLVQAVTETLRPTPVTPEPSLTADATARVPAKTPRRPRLSATSASPEHAAPNAETAATAGSKSLAAVADGTLAKASDAAEAVAPEVAPANRAAVVASDEFVPPRLIDPVRLPRWAYVATSRSSRLIELAISETGKVDRVRLVSPAVRMTDMMMLSAAKTWTFEPALQNGQPTPYTLTLNVANTP